MNVESANTLPLPEILSKLGFTPIKIEGFDLWYHSPFSNSGQLSFRYDSLSNKWQELETGKEGNTIEFAASYLESQEENHSVADALRFLRNLYLVKLRSVPTPDHSQQDDIYEAYTVMPICHTLLSEYLQMRGISLSLAQRYLKQVQVRNMRTRKFFFALGMRNEDGGYVIRNEFIKATIASRTISFIRGTKPDTSSLHVFKDMFDFLSVLAYQKKCAFVDDVLILNSYLCMEDAGAYIRNFGYTKIYTWLDNTSLGKQATDNFSAFLKTESGLRHKVMNALYAPYKDVNTFLMAKFQLAN